MARDVLARRQELGNSSCSPLHEFQRPRLPQHAQHGIWQSLGVNRKAHAAQLTPLFLAFPCMAYGTCLYSEPVLFTQLH